MEAGTAMKTDLVPIQNSWGETQTTKATEEKGGSRTWGLMRVAGLGRKWIGEGAPAGAMVTNRGLCARYSDTLSAILSPSVEYRTHWKPNIGSQNVSNIDGVD